MGMDNVVFLEVIEWFDKAGNQLAHRIPERGSAEIKFGAQLVVRDSQAAVFFYNGKAYDAIGPGRHTLKTGNIPILNKILSIPWGMQSPLRAEVCFVNMKIFPNLKWGTKDPVAFKDSELGLVRLRAFGIFNIQVIQPVLFINNLVGTQTIYTTEDLEDFIAKIILSRFNDQLGERLDTLLNLPGKYEEMSTELEKIVELDLSHYGLALQQLYINSITPPPEVQEAIDDRSRLGVFDDMNKLLQLKAAMAIEKASDNQGTGGAGMGMGLGFMMPAMFASQFGAAGGAAAAGAAGVAGGPPQGTSPAPQEGAGLQCPECQHTIGKEDRFCPTCGHQLLVFQQCESCGKNLPPHAAFCSRCGAKVEHVATVRNCGKCGSENLKSATFCNQCGERL